MAKKKPAAMPAPKAFKNLPADQRRRANDAWRAISNLTDAIDRWTEWIHLQNTLGIETGDAIAKQGRAAINVLRELRVNSPAFQGTDDPENPGPLYYWPCPPSELFDPTYYEAGNPPDTFNRDLLARDLIKQQLFVMRHILRPELVKLAELLEQSPDAALRSSAEGLGERERIILDVVGDIPLTGEQVAKKSGYQYNGDFRQTLASMKRQGLLKSPPNNRGYLRGPKAD